MPIISSAQRPAAELVAHQIAAKQQASARCALLIIKGDALGIRPKEWYDHWWM